jgi:hypothetical protein
MTSPTTAPRLIVLGIVFSIAASTATGSSAWAGERREAQRQQEAQALSTLSPSDLKRYFAARRELERKSSDQRQAQLRSLEDCLERSRQPAGAGTCLEQAGQQRKRDRSQWKQQMAALRQRYQLPPMRGRSLQGRPGQQVWQPGSTSLR